MVVIDLRNSGKYIIYAILALGLFFTQFSDKGIENDKKIDNRELNNYVEIK